MRCDAERHALLVTLHHIVADGVSVELFVQELASGYARCLQAVGSPLPSLDVQYSDYARWQRLWLESGESEQQLAYWRERLGVPPRSLLSGETLRKQARISKDRWQALAQQAQACGATISEWYGSIDPVSASDCTIEAWQADGSWSRVASPQR